MKYGLTLLAGIAGLAGQVHAQDAQDIKREEVEEIIVYGTREDGYRATVAPQVNKTDTPLQEKIGRAHV